MSTLIIIFLVGYAFHWIYKAMDKIFSLLSELKRKKEDL